MSEKPDADTIGKFEKTIKAFVRELIKRKFWGEGMLNMVNNAEKEFPTLRELKKIQRMVEACADEYTPAYEDERKNVKKLVDGFKKWFGNKGKKK